MSAILVVMEQAGGKWHRMSWEALACGVELGKQLNLPVEAAVAGSGIGVLAAEAADKAISKVHSVDHALLQDYTADAFTAAVQQLIQKTSPAVVLYPHTYQVRDFAPKVATRFGRVLVSDVVAVKVDGGTLTFVRQLFQGKMNADFQMAGSGAAFASIQAGAFRADSLADGSAAVENFTPALDSSTIRVKIEAPFRESSRAVDLTAAEIIVSVGRGIKDKDNIHIVEELAAALGGELAASRPICDAGWLPM